MMTNIISIISAKHINLIRSKNIDSGIDWSRGGEIETVPLGEIKGEAIRVDTVQLTT